MKSLPRFAPLIAILALLVLVAIGGSALANNTSTPQVGAETATVKLNPSSTTSHTPAPETAEPSLETPAAQVPADSAAVAPAPIPAPAVNPAPQIPLNYQYYDTDDDGDDDWSDDDWGTDQDDDWDED